MATAAVARHHHQQQHRAPSRSEGIWRRRRLGGAAVVRCSSPAQEFASLAAVFRRRLVFGATTAAAAAVGANFGGVTSFLLGLSPELGRSLRLDVLYPVGGFTRCLDSDNGFEFIYPSTWVGDQTLLYRAVKKAELQRSLDLPPIQKSPSRPRNISEPVAAFGPPGSNGELNVSVIVSPVPQDFSIEAFGGPKDVGEVVLRRIARTRRSPDINATLIDAALREDAVQNVKYYKLEFRVESPSFQRHNVAVCCARDGKLYTLNAQAPESAWKKVRKQFSAMADSFSLVVDA
ncbi:hypothetical protein ACP70R_038930 [Stipagrostis hirtigluma subsp. patula]